MISRAVLRVACLWELVLASTLPLRGQENRQTPTPKASAEQDLWTIGIYTGPSPFELSAPSNVKNPVLGGRTSRT